MKTAKRDILSAWASIGGGVSIVAIAAMAWWVPAGSGALSFWIMLTLLAALIVCGVIRVVCTILDVGKA